MNTTAFQIARICVVIALVCAAAAMATPRGRLPLALRGLARLLRKDGDPAAAAALESEVVRPSAARRCIAFLLVLIAICLALV